MEQEYTHWRDVPMTLWRWKNFSPAELACRGTGRLLIDEDALDRLQKLREHVGSPLIITSAYRSPQHNARVGGKKGSLHLQGKAYDIAVANHDPAHLIRAAKQCGFQGIGTYPRQGFVHVDTGSRRQWGTPFPERRNSRFASDTPDAPATAPVVTASAGTAVGAALGGEPLIRAAQVVAEQQGEFGSGDLIKVVVALVIVGLTLYVAFRPKPLGD